MMCVSPLFSPRQSDADLRSNGSRSHGRPSRTRQGDFFYNGTLSNRTSVIIFPHDFSALLSTFRSVTFFKRNMAVMTTPRHDSTKRNPSLGNWSAIRPPPKRQRRAKMGPFAGPSMEFRISPMRDLDRPMEMCARAMNRSTSAQPSITPAGFSLRCCPLLCSGFACRAQRALTHTGAETS